MDELIKAARAVLEDFDLYGQPISLRLLADLRRAVEAAQQSFAPDPPSACEACGTLLEEPTHDPTCPLFTAGR